MKHSIILGTLLLSLSSCLERPADLDQPPYQPKLVVNALISNEEDLVIQVSESVGALSPEEPDYLGDANIELRANGVLTAPLTYDSFSFVYELFEKPVPGVRYDLVVTHPKFTAAATASTTLPRNVVLNNLNLIDSVGVDSAGAPISELTFDLSDPAGDENFYRLGMLYYSPALTQFLPFEFNTSDAVLLNPSTVQLDDGSYQFNDVLFNGQTRKFTVRFPSTLATSTPRFMVQVEALSEDYFKYINSIELYNSSGNNPLQEPVFIHSNVSGGLGIFAGAITLRDTIY